MEKGTISRRRVEERVDNLLLEYRNSGIEGGVEAYRKKVYGGEGMHEFTDSVVDIFRKVLGDSKSHTERETEIDEEKREEIMGMLSDWYGDTNPC